MAHKTGRTILAISVGSILTAATFAVANLIVKHQAGNTTGTSRKDLQQPFARAAGISETEAKKPPSSKSDTRDSLEGLAPKAAIKKAKADLRLQEDLARKAGIPLTATDLVQPIPVSMNAAALYAKAYALYKTLSPDPDRNAALNDLKINDQVSAATAASALNGFEPIMGEVARAAKLPRCQFGKTPLDGPDGFPTLAQIKFYAKIAAFRARLETYRGQPATSLIHLSGYTPMAAQLAQTPTTLPALASYAISAIFCRSISDILAAHGKEQGVAEAAEKALGGLGKMPNIVRLSEGENLVLLNEVKSFLPASAKPSSKPDEDDMDRLVRAAFHPGMIDEWRARQLEYVRRLVQLYRGGGNDYTSLGAQADALLKARCAPPTTENELLRLPGPDFQSKTLNSLGKAISLRRVLAQSAAIFEAWTKTGRIPDTLPLSGVAAIDPLNGKSLHYSHTTVGFKVYGVGDRGVDHGGKAQAPGQTEGYDIVFEYPAK